jgi:histidinol-phosphate phosphatase family protein
MKQVVILAGGMGSRLKEMLGDLPKPMLKIGGKSLLEHQVILAKKYGFKKILLLTSFNSHYITNFFGDGSRWDILIEYQRETLPLGTAGAVIDAWDMLDKQFIVMYGDTMVNVDLNRLVAAHADRQADLTLLLHPNDHPYDSDLVELDSSGWIKALYPYPHLDGVWLPNLTNAALYVMNKDILLPWKNTKIKADFAKNIFPLLVSQRRKIYGYKSPEYIKDVGTPKRYKEVTHAYNVGRIARDSFSVPKPAVFIDRDGTLVDEVNLISHPEQLRLIDNHVASDIRRINNSDYYAIVITNQPVVSRGDCTFEELKVIHNKLETLLGQEGAYLDHIYFCPHHTDKGFLGEVPELKFNCDCRKPNIGMILLAAREFNIDLSKSWMVGNSSVDIETARRAGIKAILVKTGHGGKDARYICQADKEFSSLSESVEFILTCHEPI